MSDKLAMLPQLLLDGFAFGSLYALIALALVIVYKTSEVLNFAQGEISMVSTFIGYTLLHKAGLPFWAAFLGAAGLGALLGAILHTAFLRPAKDPNLLGLIVITIALQFILFGVAGWIWGTETSSFDGPLDEMSFQVIRIGGLALSQLNLIIIGVSIALLALIGLFFQKTKYGIAMRAIADNETAARLMGVPVERMFAVTWGMAGVLGAIVGMLIVPTTYLDTSMMLNPLMGGFAGATLGGLSSLPGAVLGGWMLGIIENLVGAYLSTQFKSTVAFVIIILVLILRPEGVLGRPQQRKV